MDFIRYKKSDDSTKVLLIYLLLNGLVDEKKIKMIQEETETVDNLTVIKKYGYTNGFVDVSKIYSDINRITAPIVCSTAAFEYYSVSDEIYVYTPKDIDGEKRFIINDLNIISNIMVINPDIVVSSKKAMDITDLAENKRLGFTYFAEYVLENKVSVGKWDIAYKDNTFTVHYGGVDVYKAIELDKTSTYKIVIYIIEKCGISDFKPDAYSVEKYRMQK